MDKYRKKPIIIEAEQFWPDHPWPDMVRPWNILQPRDMSWGYIKTLEGDMHVHAGDWIIKGVEGEFYPCNDSIFKATYELVGD
jgi:hypothetical protein